MLVTLDFFMQLFNKTFNIGTNVQEIANKQQINEIFVVELLAMNENQFTARIKNLGYSITTETPTANIIFYVCYVTAQQLIAGQYTSVMSDSSLKVILEMAKSYEILALDDVNLIVQQIPIGGHTIQMPIELLNP